MRRTLTLFAALCWVALLPQLAAAQATAPAVAALTEGVRAYDDLDFDRAAGLLRRALSVQGKDALPPADAERALVYLAATELLREHRDTARAVARRLTLANPRFRPDELVFPPQVLTLFQEVRRVTLAVMARAPADTAIRPGSENLAVRLYASTFHDVAAILVSEDGRQLRVLYAGPIGDSLDLHWNGMDSTGQQAASGRYAITVSSLDRNARVARILRLPLEVGRFDTLPHPAPPADSLLLPEHRAMGPALKALAPGALAGAAIAILPSVIAPDEKTSSARFVIGGTVTIAGIAAFLSHRPGAPIAANVEHNRAIRDAWRREVAEVSRRNAERHADRISVRTGAAVVLTPNGP